MTELFEPLEGGLHYTVNPSLRYIDEFNKLIRRDRGSGGDFDGRKKRQATKELAFIFHMCHHSSPYQQYLEEERKERLGDDLFEDSDYEPDDEVVAAMKKFIELTRTPLSRLLDSAHTAVNRLSEYFNNVDLEQTDDKGQLVNKPRDVLASLSSLGKTVASLQQLEEQVAKEQAAGNKIRGNVSLTRWSE